MGKEEKALRSAASSNLRNEFFSPLKIMGGNEIELHSDPSYLLMQSEKKQNKWNAVMQNKIELSNVKKEQMSEMLGKFFLSEKKGKEAVKNIQLDIDFKNEKNRERMFAAKETRKHNEADR